MLTVLGMAASSARASFQISPDAPTGLSGTTLLPSQVAFCDAGTCSLTLSLPDGTAIDGLHRMSAGDWLLSLAAPAALGGTAYDARDVVRLDGVGAFTLVLDGAASGVPAGSDVDAIFLDGGDSGDLVVSFDVPTTIGGTTYDPADLVRFSAGGFTLYFDASGAAPPIPITTNVTGAAQAGALLVLAFDVPIALGVSTVLPGDLVSWNGAAFSAFAPAMGWPLSSYVNAVADITCAAEACDGQDTDCDGAIDVSESDGDGDGFRGCGGDCDDTNPALFPGNQEVCDVLDNDCNGLVDEIDADGDGVGLCLGDCNDMDSGAFLAPGAIEDLQTQLVAGVTRYTWTSQLAAAGPGTAYDAFTGLITSVGAIDYSMGACAADDLPVAVFDDFLPAPPPGTSRYVIFRAQNSCAAGSYGTPEREAGVALSPSPCP